jgi:hypothetical protein
VKYGGRSETFLHIVFEIFLNIVCKSLFIRHGGDAELADYN